MAMCNPFRSDIKVKFEGFKDDDPFKKKYEETYMKKKVCPYCQGAALNCSHCHNNQPVGGISFFRKEPARKTGGSGAFFGIGFVVIIIVLCAMKLYDLWPK